MDTDGNGKDSQDQHTASARQMVVVMLSHQDAIRSFMDKALVSPRNLDATPLIMDALAAQSRTLAFILDELLIARGEARAIVFRETPAAVERAIAMVPQ